MTFSEEICLPYLRAAQNPDGGWGFRSGSQSRIEPTAWALLALDQVFPANAASEAIARGVRFLSDSQLPDGSWPAAAGQGQGSWVTSLACWAFLSTNENRDALKRGLSWLVAERPGDSGAWWRLHSPFDRPQESVDAERRLLGLELDFRNSELGRAYCIRASRPARIATGSLAAAGRRPAKTR